MHVFFKGKLEFLDNTYLQKQSLLKFHKLGVEIKDKYVIPNEHLSYSYPFNFVEFVQTGGLLKKADRENLLIIDNQRKGGNQMLFEQLCLVIKEVVSQQRLKKVFLMIYTTIIAMLL